MGWGCCNRQLDVLLERLLALDFQLQSYLVSLLVCNYLFLFYIHYIGLVKADRLRYFVYFVNNCLLVLQIEAEGFLAHRLRQAIVGVITV